MNSCTTNSSANFSFLFLFAHFFVQHQTLHDDRCLCALTIHIFRYFLCTRLDATIFSSTIALKGPVAPDIFPVLFQPSNEINHN
jgi:hypothetical protein